MKICPRLQERLEEAEAQYEKATAMHARLEAIRQLKGRLDLMSREKKENQGQVGTVVRC